MHKVDFFAEPSALVLLGNNRDFTYGHVLRYILKNHAKISLIITHEDFKAEWENPESNLRHFCSSYDIPTPTPKPELLDVYKNPIACCQKYPFAIWLFNRTENDTKIFREYLGIWAINTPKLNEGCFELYHSRRYLSGGINVDGAYSNGWSNLIDEIPGSLPPINSIVLNDRHLLSNIYDISDTEKGFCGLVNLKSLLSSLLPYKLAVPFHIYILCQHPDLDAFETDAIINKFIIEVRSLRKYIIDIEFVFERSYHERRIFTNYFYIFADRGFNAFKVRNLTRLNGENKIDFVTYLNNPYATGDNTYESDIMMINAIGDKGKNVKSNPKLSTNNKFEEIERVRTSCLDMTHYFINRLID